MKESKSLVESTTQYTPALSSNYTEYGMLMEKRAKLAFVSEQKENIKISLSLSQEQWQML